MGWKVYISIAIEIGSQCDLSDTPAVEVTVTRTDPCFVNCTALVSHRAQESIPATASPI